MIGRTLSHFEVTAKLGKGGMGEVYRARDTKLGRYVALKVLAPEVASDSDRLARLEREAKTVAALNHPNIVTIFSVEKADGIHFLTMELVAGNTIDGLLPPSGFSLDRFFALAAPIADAVASAHARGVVHRDLKPANVMVTDEDDRVKVLDFGLAKLRADDRADASSQLTTLTQAQDGVIAGTPCYMSPEQARGETVDYRTDIFSLGVMLFEMATGKRPFHGETSLELLSSVLKDSPPVLTEIKPGLPRHLGRIVGRCLEKAPVERYQTARDVYNELRALRRETQEGGRPGSATNRAHDRAGTARILGISVLPIDSDSEDSELCELARGLTEDVAGGLAAFTYLSVAEFDPGDKQIPAGTEARPTAKERGVRYLLTGSLRRVGETIRLGVRLIDALEGERLWSETFDHSSHEIAKIQVQDALTDRIVATVADGGGVLVRAIAERLRSIPNEELNGRDWVVRTFAYFDQLRQEERADLRSGLEQAVARGPADSAIWSCLALIFLEEHTAGLNARSDPLGRALRAAQRAVELDPRNSLAMDALAETHFFLRDMTSFRLAVDKALALNPRDASTQAAMGMWLALSGELRRGAKIARRAMELNPHHAGWYLIAPFFYHYERREYEQALGAAKRMNMPHSRWSWMMLAAAAGQLGIAADALAAVAKLEGFFPERARSVLEKTEMSIVPVGLREHFLEGMRKAGLAFPLEAG